MCNIEVEVKNTANKEQHQNQNVDIDICSYVPIIHTCIILYVYMYIVYIAICIHACMHTCAFVYICIYTHYVWIYLSIQIKREKKRKGEEKGGTRSMKKGGWITIPIWWQKHPTSARSQSLDIKVAINTFRQRSVRQECCPFSNNKLLEIPLL